MRLVVIYGPPAAGKHTVGQKLAELTGYKFFYNHLTVDVARALFDDEDTRRNKLLDALRVTVITTAARYKMNIIFTMGYTDNEHSRAFVNNLIQAVTENNGKPHFVRLNPPDATLFERVGNESRAKLRKPTSAQELEHLLRTRNFRTTINYPSQLELDTSQLTPEESARRVIGEFGLL